MWQGQLRNSSPHGTEYLDYRNKCGPIYRPEDAYIGDTISILSALDAGITTILDWSHIQNTPEHTDAVIRALQNGGIRAVFAYGWPMPGSVPWWKNSATRYPGDIRRLRKQYFASDDQLLTLAMGPTSKNAAVSALEKNPEQIKQEWSLAREVGARISLHTSGRGSILALAKQIRLGPDTTYVHCRRFSNEEFKMIADSGGTVSLCPSLDTLQGRGLPPIQEVLENGMRPSLSVDEEMDAPNDMFTQMRLALSLQRGLLGGRLSADDPDIKGLISARDVLEFATIEGARANGLEQKTGSLTPGKEADVILLRKDRINVLPVNDPVGAVVLAMDTGNVDSVFVAGKAKKRHGQLLGVDLKQIAARAIESRQYLLTQAKMS
jgi:cytosine/adenosine deaminase-related metal-dependent hydrolase